MSNRPHQHADALRDQKANQRLLLLFFGVVCIVVIGLRLRLVPALKADALDTVYNGICEDIHAGRPLSDDVYDAARKQIRTMGTHADALFIFQYVATVSGRSELPAAMETLEAPIRDDIAAGRFDDARAKVRDAVITSDTMTTERSEVWGKFIREMERRWTNNCRPPDAPTP